MPRLVLSLDHPVDLRQSLALLRHGPNDPTTRFARDGIWRATRTATGPATLHLIEQEGAVLAEAWGPGADAVLERLPGWVGAEDTEPFHTDHPLVSDLHRRSPGLRIVKTGAVFEALLAAICEQKVTGFEARRAWEQLVRRFGEPAPGPADLMVLPSPDVLASAGYYEFHPLGLEKKRADVIRRVAAHATRLDALADVGIAEAHARMQAVPGVGPWTSNEVAIVALGDTDAVSVGDYHLKNVVSWALAGRPRGTDTEMLELLEEFRPHRGRVIRLLESAGIGAPRYGPRLAPRRIERH